ncbi:unnamed protein product [Phytophthora lilii]|uniref:Unnamed protein product n=1 Tax=Phytophthora lilii TaxID=2077276 RepID=A0A9W6UBJ9_9STRA|nr:unnamed protein product [Phytophthora lilii]
MYRIYGTGMSEGLECGAQDVDAVISHKWQQPLVRVTLLHHKVGLPVPARQSTVLTIVKLDPSWKNSRAHSAMSTPQPTSSKAATTEKTIAVAKYHALQGEKRGVDTGTCTPKHVLESSCVVSGDESNDMPLAFKSNAPEEGKAEEEEKASPTQHKNFQYLSGKTPDPQSGSRRLREDGPDASRSKRLRGESDSSLSASHVLSRSDTVLRDPWMPTDSAIAGRFGSTMPPYNTPFDVNRYTGIRVPDDLKELRAVVAREAPNVVGDYNVRTVFTPAVHGGLPTPSPFPERPPSRRSAVPTYPVGERVLSNEYENEPDLGPELDDTQRAQQSSALHPSRPLGEVVAAGIRPSYSQRPADYDLVARAGCRAAPGVSVCAAEAGDSVV